jgi:alpha-ketoglutarate-dependent taurine dioxygenase
MDPVAPVAVKLCEENVMSSQDIQIIDDPAAWKSSDFDTPRSWVRTLTPAMIDDVESAMRGVMNADIPLRKIRREQFPLSVAAGLVATAHADLNEGRGFTVIGGWPVERFSDAENRVAYAGLAAHMGEIVVQNYEGDFVVDVVDKGIPYSHKSRGYSSNKLLPFHTDGADYAGLLCLEVAAEGGFSLLTSATEVYNEIVRTRPDHIETLMRGFYHHRRGQHDPGEPPLSPKRIPVFSFHDGFLHCCYNRNPIDWAQKEGITLSDHEIEVLDYFDEICARPDVQLSMDLQKGDMQFLNNYLILHSRTEYQDGVDAKRHLVRLWLDDSTGRRNGLSLLDLYVPAASRFTAASGSASNA